MARKPANIAGLLSEGGFASRQASSLPTTPVSPTRIVLDIEQIREYEGNPRTVPNELYESIKESIRAEGLRIPLVVTQRPGDEHYIPAAGGNTRLKALRELWEETGDDRFRTLEALYKPWISEEWVLISHLVENELRGEMRFIDKARAIARIHAELERKQSERVSERAFEKHLLQLGLPLSRRQIRRLLYAASLETVIPNALPHLGPTHIDHLSRLEKIFTEINGARPDDSFRKLLSGMDAHDLDSAAVESAIKKAAVRSGSIQQNRPRSRGDGKPGRNPNSNNKKLLEAAADCLGAHDLVEEQAPKPKRSERLRYAAWWSLNALRREHGETPDDPVPEEIEFLLRLARDRQLLDAVLNHLGGVIPGEEDYER